MPWTAHLPNLQTCTKPRCGLNTSRASLKAKLANILLDLEENKSSQRAITSDFGIELLTTSLPKKQLKAFWLESRTER